MIFERLIIEFFFLDVFPRNFTTCIQAAKVTQSNNVNAPEQNYIILFQTRNCMYFLNHRGPKFPPRKTSMRLRTKPKLTLLLLLYTHGGNYIQIQRERASQFKTEGIRVDGVAFKHHALLCFRLNYSFFSSTIPRFPSLTKLKRTLVHYVYKIYTPILSTRTYILHSTARGRPLQKFYITAAFCPSFFIYLCTHTTLNALLTHVHSFSQPSFSFSLSIFFLYTPFNLSRSLVQTSCTLFPEICASSRAVLLVYCGLASGAFFFLIRVRI